MKEWVEKKPLLITDRMLDSPYKLSYIPFQNGGRGVTLEVSLGFCTTLSFFNLKICYVTLYLYGLKIEVLVLI